MKKILALALALLLALGLVACAPQTTETAGENSNGTEQTQDPVQDEKAVKTQFYHTLAATPSIMTEMLTNIDITVESAEMNARIILSDGYLKMQIGESLIELVRTAGKTYLHAAITYAGETTEGWYSSVMSDEEDATLMESFSGYTEMFDTVNDIVFDETVTIDGVAYDKVTVKATSTEEYSGEQVEEELTMYFNAATHAPYKMEAVEDDAKVTILFPTTPVAVPDVSTVNAEEQAADNFAMTFAGSLMGLLFSSGSLDLN